MNAPSGYRLQQAVVIMQKALAGEHDEDGVLHDPEQATEDVEELLARVLRAAVEAEMMLVGIDARLKALRERGDRFEDRRDALRATAFAAMDVLERNRVELPDLTASIKKNAPRVVITDETLLPPELTETQVLPNKMAIKAALAKGPVPGAELSNSLPSIQIRTR